ncbi:MAG: bifunctional phosphoribosyl-AMP cyclohydrolase/phosphoribosyl-ATP diphosphatase HisIE [Gemmatimonadaceae bacterium]|nr:bifunctional phosphoribosyl-AMP cyclohydrolase/phosphoribosyl-ATP diphosphatase HisIE [Gemmatimonadaceae bacterium]MCW5827012.1 bifunctional phosphoribosyl-AMP cyclohydrolase/phosphoribosyl-ATP diphosphatase HisIE [Gemmatimonadaceae bacterium]
MIDLDQLDFRKGGGLVPVVAQDVRSGAVLMVAYADREALERTQASGELHLRSRARGAWHKGATSGNVLRVRALVADCDADTVLARVEPAGPACHTGSTSCFGATPPGDALSALDATISQRMEEAAPTGAGYTQRLLGDRNLRLKKIGEEASELVTACADGDAARATEEAADLIYHTLVALRAAGGSLDAVRAVLDARAHGAR